MVRIKRLWNAIKTLAILFSLTFNCIFIVVLMVLLTQIFQIKNGLLEPLITGLHGSFVGLDNAVINTTIPVQDTVPIDFNLPLNTDTNVTLTGDVPVLIKGAGFTLSDGTTLRGSVAISLPKGLVLPVHLNLNVPVKNNLPIDLKVHASIPLNQTELHDPFDKLRSLLDPYVRILGNLPSDWPGVIPFTGQILSGRPPDLLKSNKYIENPWPNGYTVGTGASTTPPKPTDSGTPAAPGATTGPGQLPLATLTPTPSNSGPTPTLFIPTAQGAAQATTFPPTSAVTQPAPTPTATATVPTIAPTATAAAPSATPTASNTPTPTLTPTSLTPTATPTHSDDLGIITPSKP